MFVDKYSDVKKLNPITLRDMLRNVALTTLSTIDRVIGIEEFLLKPRIQFLYIHHVFKDEETKLLQLLNKLSEHHTFVSYSEAVEKILSGTIDKPYICFSSDDGLKNNLRAANIFKEYGVKSCFFINPAVIGETNKDAIKSFCSERLHLPPVKFMDWKDVEQLQTEGHEIGSHTMSHINVAQTAVSLVKEDIFESYHLITKYCGTVSHFAYPYGRYYHFSEVGRKLVFEAGFTSCASAERGCHITDGSLIANEDLFIRRDHVILDWDIDHIMYFIANNSKKASVSNNTYSF